LTDALSFKQGSITSDDSAINSIGHVSGAVEVIILIKDFQSDIVRNSSLSLSERIRDGLQGGCIDENGL
jgi:hypothetical protein